MSPQLLPWLTIIGQYWPGVLKLTGKRWPGSKGVVCPKFRNELLLQRNLWYYAVAERSRLKEWHLWGILIEAKRSPKSFFACGGQGGRIISDNHFFYETCDIMPSGR
jgi:hypothetical protein